MTDIQLQTGLWGGASALPPAFRPASRSETDGRFRIPRLYFVRDSAEQKLGGKTEVPPHTGYRKIRVVFGQGSSQHGVD
jgi:hypothetical protein